MTKTQLFVNCIKAGFKGLANELKALWGYFILGAFFGAGLWLGASAMQALLK